jgi:hypothetical protein
MPTLRAMGDRAKPGAAASTCARDGRTRKLAAEATSTRFEKRMEISVR